MAESSGRGSMISNNVPHNLKNLIKEHTNVTLAAPLPNTRLTLTLIVAGQYYEHILSLERFSH